jgi:hypothetical protein
MTAVFETQITNQTLAASVSTFRTDTNLRDSGTRKEFPKS